MKALVQHPEDLTPFLNGEITDPGYLEIKSHLDGCAQCRSEVEKWRSFDALFRSEDEELEVPHFQWQRIAAHLRDPIPAIKPAGLSRFFQPWKLAWNLTLATLVLTGVLFTGFEYRKNLEEKQLLLAVTDYAMGEGQRVGSGNNPFRLANAPDNNPFSENGNVNRPAAGRQ